MAIAETDFEGGEGGVMNGSSSERLLGDVERDGEALESINSISMEVGFRVGAHLLRPSLFPFPSY